MILTTKALQVFFDDRKQAAIKMKNVTDSRTSQQLNYQVENHKKSWLALFWIDTPCQKPTVIMALKNFGSSLKEGLILLVQTGHGRWNIKGLHKKKQIAIFVLYSYYY